MVHLKWIRLCSFMMLFGLMLACTPEEPKDDEKVKAKMVEVVKQYGALVYANYQAVDKGLVDLQKSITDFLANPTKDGLENAKKKWLEVRLVYGQTEGFRFYGGPIDDDRGIEGRINPWPLDENYIDYVKDNDKAGIINDTTNFPTIDKKTLIDLNEKDGEKNISLGFHAIEFLLWGQDMKSDSAGERPHTDYIEGANGTAANQKRRGEYLKIAMEILLEDFRTVMKDWEPGKTDNFRGKFEAADAADSLTKILTGMGTLTGGELSGERMSTPYKEKDQEEEHSCFSDSTKTDILANAMSAQNIFLGKFGAAVGASIEELVRLKDPTLADQLKTEMEASITSIKAIPEPFDQAILGADTADGRVKVKAAIDALQKQTQTIAAVGKLFGLSVNTELP